MQCGLVRLVICSRNYAATGYCVIRYFLLALLVMSVMGCQGPAGPAGAVGSRGPQGEQGIAGSQGETGAVGSQGEQGFSGLQGEAGAVGPQGEVGPVGSEGKQGQVGEKGAAGPEGETGPLGLKGEIGPIGPQGDQGSAGEQGPSGTQGEAGPAGDAGLAGLPGDAGLAGLPGDAGPAGPRGEQGFPGDAGVDFSNLFLDEQENTKDHVILIDAGNSTGSGVLIGPGEILTAEHVIRGQSQVLATIPGRGLVNATVIGWDASRDLAVLNFSADGSEYIATISTGPEWTGEKWTTSGEIGSPVVAIGYIKTISSTVPMTSFGHISTWWSVMPGEISTIGFDSAVTFGMSGGGLFDINGKLVGIVIQKSTLIQSDNRAVRYNEIEEALPELRAGAQNP